MKKLFIAAFACMMCTLFMSGCAGVFEKEYVAVNPYTVQTQTENSDADKVTVKDAAELRQAVMGMVYDGVEQGTIDFDSEYPGQADKDMAEVCWQVRTQDALSAFCVKALDFTLEKIVTHYEATVKIDYTDYAPELGSIIKLPYTVGVRNYLKSAMEDNITRLVMLVNISTFSVNQIESLAQSIYRTYPTICVREPHVKVFMYSGNNGQRLYDINLDYGMSEDEVIRGKAQLKNLDVASKLDSENLDDAHAALAAARYIVKNCRIASEGSSCFDCLINNRANSEGVSLAYVEMLSQLGIDCKIVYGQRNGVNCCWNIIKIDGDYYHVDVCRCASDGYMAGFLCSDEKMWNDYRWNISDYESCAGDMSFLDVASPEELELMLGTMGNTDAEPGEDTEKLPEEKFEENPEETQQTDIS